MPHFVYYAPGGGLGHLTRGIAILRAWQRSGGHGTLLTNSPLAGLAAGEQVRVRAIAQPQDAPAAIERARPDLLAVDTFPRGIVGELAGWLDTVPTPRVLIQRHLNPRYIEQFDVSAFADRHYDLAVRLGDSLAPQPLHARTVDVPAVTIRVRAELSFPRARNGWLFLGWDDGSGPFIEAAEQEARLAGRKLRVLRSGACYPAVKIMSSFELLIAGAGYNAFHEAALARTPAIFVPQKRTYDDQLARAASARSARTPQELRDALRQPLPPPLPCHDGTGAAAAVSALRAFLRSPRQR